VRRSGQNSPVRRRLAAGLALVAAIGALAGPGGAGAAAADGPAVADLPIVPRIDAAMKERLRAVLAHGKVLGNRPRVFAKVGDSISAGSAFLSALDCSRPARWGRFPHLRSTVTFYRRQHVTHASVPCEPTTSFGRASRAAVPGWTVDDALAFPGGEPRDGCERGESPLECEYRDLAPAVAIVMYGTNDVGYTEDPTRFRQGLRELVRTSVDWGVIPILSTIPPRLDRPRIGRRVAAYNAAIARVAREEQVPLLNYWRSLQGPRVIHFGLGDDGVHPQVLGRCRPHCLPLDFTRRGLRYGVNLRNLTALQALHKVRRVVLQDGEPDPRRAG
jgi:hypothetical protein